MPRTKRRTTKRKYKLTLRRSPVQTKMVTKLKYVDNIFIPAGLYEHHVFSASGLYDPDITSGGHQPRGFDQLMALYDHYVVIGSKCVVQTLQLPQSGRNNCVGIALKDSNGSFGDQNAALESGYVVSKLHSSDRNEVLTQTMRYSPKVFLGRSAPLADPDLKGTVSSNPVENAFYHIFNSPAEGISNSTIQCMVTIEYIVAFIEPKNPAQS